nr:phosphomannose isomerase type I family protein [Rhodococcus sp. JVH1]
MLKVLAAEQPLSPPAHPSAAQARDGFERENAAGIALVSPVRNYRDDSHKPELVVALSKFEALAGFRDARRTAELLTALGVAELDPYVEQLAEHPNSSGVRALFTQWMSVGSPDVTLITDVLDGCEPYLSAQPHGTAGEFAAEVQTALDLGRRYPGDPGVLASLLLNRVSLEPGEGLHLAAGNLHAYLRGTAVEIMANSDNVLRGGLTPKHVDLPELLRVLDFDPLEVPMLRPAANGLDGTLVYETAAPEFQLTRVELDKSGPHGPDAISIEVDGPQILVCTAGSAVASSGLEKFNLRQGQAVWISASDPAISLQAEKIKRRSLWPLSESVLVGYHSEGLREGNPQGTEQEAV